MKKTLLGTITTLMLLSTMYGLSINKYHLIPEVFNNDNKSYVIPEDIIERKTTGFAKFPTHSSTLTLSSNCLPDIGEPINISFWPEYLWRRLENTVISTV